MRIVLLWLGGMAVALGLAFSLFPLGTATGSCGNAWSNGNDASYSLSSGFSAQEVCTGARGGRWVTIGTLVGLGAAGLAASSDLRTRERAAATTPAAATPAGAEPPTP